MEKETFWSKTLDFIWWNRIRAAEYYFAKRWLDRNFGVQEYWGDYLMEKLKS